MSRLKVMIVACSQNRTGSRVCFRPKAAVCAGRGERLVRAHCGSDDILLRALAARLMLHSRCFSCRIAALEAVIHLACSILLAVTPIVLSGLTRAKQSQPHQSKTSFLPATLCLSAWHSNRPRAAPISSGTMRRALALCCPTENWA